ncbi:MAG TPA: hypothetical protein VFO66_01310 [Gemmatimonadaceae bacterium]|nr:hypothetical protein [Gemmatimonadaceae bacterium]
MVKRILIVPFCLTAIGASCGRDPQARADTTADSATVVAGGNTRFDSAAGYVVASGQDSIRKKDSLRPDTNRRVDTPLPDSGRSDSAVAKDSQPAAAALSVTMAPGRPKRDSLALVYALRKFEKEPGWPVRGPAPKAGAILPNKRIVAYYGNPLSKRMGILGEIPPDEMLAKLDGVVKEWEKADPDVPVQRALHYISVVAQGAPGRDGKFRLRMDSSRIEEVYGWAKKANAIMFLDIQTGFSTVAEEMPRLMKFLERPDVHFAIDPEFHMHHDKAGVQPGKKIGTLTHVEINYAIDQLSKLVREKNLPPKVLVIHRFTRPMVRGYDKIKLDPNVQVVMHMDGWGAPWLKFDSYKDYIVDEPVQYTGFKLFYKNDTKKGDKLLTAGELVQLKPRLMYIQYQ